mgnify:CR=1 FL=1
MPFVRVNANTVVIIDDVNGTARNLSAYITSVSAIGRKVAALDVTSFADAVERIIAGVEESGEVTVQGKWNTDATGPNGYYPALVGTINTVEVGPNGTAAGARRIRGEFLCTSYDVLADVKGEVQWQAVHKLDGTLDGTGTY